MQGKRKCNIGAIKGENGKIITDAKEKAKDFNQFFAKVEENLAAKMQVDLPDNENAYIHPVTPTLQDTPFNTTIFKNTIDKRVKPGKSCGPDNIGSRELKLQGHHMSWA